MVDADSMALEAGTIYVSGSFFAYYYEIGTGEMKVITWEQSGLPTFRHYFGTFSQLGDGNLLLRVHDDSVFKGLKLPPSLDVSEASVWSVIPDDSVPSGWAQPHYANGVYDAVTNLNWTDWYNDGYSYTGLDNDGLVGGHLGDLSTVGDLGGSGVYGALTESSNLCRIGRNLYRQSSYADLILRTNIDTGAWHYILTDLTSIESGDYFHLHGATETHLVGTRYMANPSDLTHGQTVMYDPDDQPWLPVGTPASGMAEALTNPTATWDLNLLSAGGLALSTQNEYGGTAVVQNNALYFMEYVDRYEYEGTIVHKLWEQSLTNGVVSLVADIPYVQFNEEGVIGGSTWGSNDDTAYGMVLGPPLQELIFGAIDRTDRRFTPS